MLFHNFKFGIPNNLIVKSPYVQHYEIPSTVPPPPAGDMLYEDGETMLFEDGTSMEYE